MGIVGRQNLLPMIRPMVTELGNEPLWVIINIGVMFIKDFCKGITAADVGAQYAINELICPAFSSGFGFGYIQFLIPSINQP